SLSGAWLSRLAAEYFPRHRTLIWSISTKTPVFVRLPGGTAVALLDDVLSAETEMRIHSTTSDAEHELVIATSFEDDDSRHNVDLESCSEREWIVVQTRNSMYDLIVLSGDTGAVMIRGGELFKEF